MVTAFIYIEVIFIEKEHQDIDLLKYAISNGMIDLSYVQEKIDMDKRTELLKRHPYKIWCSNNLKWYTYLPDKQKGRILKKRKSQKEIEDIVVEYWKEHESIVSIESIFQKWVDRILFLNRISLSTKLRYTQTFNRFYKSDDNFGGKNIKDITFEQLSEFLEDQVPKHNLTAKAFLGLKTITRGIFKTAKKNQLIYFSVEEVFDEMELSENSFKQVIKEDYEEVFDESETLIITEYLESHIDEKNICLLLMFVTGLRIGEIVSLKHDDICGNTINIRRTETRYKDDAGTYVYKIKEFPKSKAGVRTVVVADDYLWLINKINKLNPFVEFVFMNDNDRMHAYSIRNRLNRLCDKLNIYHKSPHKIRKTYGTILLDNHVDKKLVIDQMGHADIAVSERHYHRNRKTVSQKAQIISAIPDFKRATTHAI